MKEFRYTRPQTIEEAVGQLGQGAVMAGGTTVTPRRLALDGVIDLQALKLEMYEVQDDRLRLGAGLRLQALVEHAQAEMEVLGRVCLQEAGWNLRNMATLGGTLMSGDGRSPLLVLLRAWSGEALLSPGDRRISLDDLLSWRGDSREIGLLLEVELPLASRAAYHQVARSPADLPIIAAAVVRRARGGYGVALGGYGDLPLRVPEAEAAFAAADAPTAQRAAAEAYRAAGDAWASAEYRSEMAAVLVGRLAAEVIG
jgi:aerobic carbon-monoxide dehydrogenase medium subunit